MCKTIKTYTENDAKYQFDCEKLKRCMVLKIQEMKSQGIKGTKKSITNDLSEKLFISYEAVKNWTYGTNGPSDLEQVRKIAEYFGIEYHNLLSQEEKTMNINENTSNDQLTDTQKAQTHACVRDVYVAMFEAIDMMWSYYHAEDKHLLEKYSEEEYAEHNIVQYEEAEASVIKVTKLLNKYMLDIPQSFSDKIYKWFSKNVQYRLTDIVFLFITLFDEPDPDELKELEDTIKFLKSEEIMYKEGFYHKELRDLFSEYVLP